MTLQVTISTPMIANHLIWLVEIVGDVDDSTTPQLIDTLQKLPTGRSWHYVRLDFQNCRTISASGARVIDSRLL